MVELETLKRIIVESQQFIVLVELNRRDYAFEPKGRYVLKSSCSGTVRQNSRMKSSQIAE